MLAQSMIKQLNNDGLVKEACFPASLAWVLLNLIRPRASGQDKHTVFFICGALTLVPFLARGFS